MDNGFQYILDRKVSLSTMGNFFLGYCNKNVVRITCPSSGDKFPQEWKSFIDNNKEMYNGSLIFPMIDVCNNITGLAFRKIGSKNFYYNLGFNKTKCLYGIHDALLDAHAKKFVIVVEGLFDALVGHSLGLKNVVAVLGSRISHHQACSIKRYTDNVLIIGDGDAGGKALIDNGSKMLKEVGVKNIKTMYVPGKDPDDIFLSGEYQLGEF